MSSNGTSYIPHSPAPREHPCCGCGENIADRIYRVKRRKIRAVQYDEEGRPRRHDGVHNWHDGVIVGPETDDYCSECFKLIPTIQELLDDHKRSLHTRSP